MREGTAQAARTGGSDDVSRLISLNVGDFLRVPTD
jgi:hypothetical protein